CAVGGGGGGGGCGLGRRGAGGDRDDEPLRRERRVSPGVRAQPHSRGQRLGGRFTRRPGRRVGLPARYIRSRRLIFSTSVVRFTLSSLAARPLLPPVRSSDR